MSDDESVVLRPRELFEDAILTQNADELAKFMDQPFTAIAEVITGEIAAGPKAWMVQTGHIVQGMLKGKLFQTMGREIKDLREKGKIPDDFADEQKYRYGAKTWVELLAFIDQEIPDADRLEAVKAMFYSVNKANTTDGEKVISYQLFQIAKKLTSGELLLLRAILDAKDEKFGGVGKVIELSSWAHEVANKMGHSLSFLVLRDQSALVENGLISGFVPGRADQQMVYATHARMTDLGFRFCDEIRKYHKDTTPEPSE